MLQKSPCTLCSSQSAVKVYIIIVPMFAMQEMPAVTLSYSWDNFSGNYEKRTCLKIHIICKKWENIWKLPVLQDQSSYHAKKSLRKCEACGKAGG